MTVADSVLKEEADIISCIISLTGQFNGRYGSRLSALLSEDLQGEWFLENPPNYDEASTVIAGARDRKIFQADAQAVLAGVKQFANCHVKRRPTRALAKSSLDNEYRITSGLIDDFYQGAKRISAGVTFTHFSGLENAMHKPISQSLGLVTGMDKIAQLKERGKAVFMTDKAGDMADMAAELLALREENPELMKEGLINPYLGSKTTRILAGLENGRVETVSFNSLGPKLPSVH